MPRPTAEPTSPFLSDALWLLTTGAEARRSAPHTVLLGVAAAGLCDLEAIGEVTWSGLGDTSRLRVRPSCRCEDPTLRRWHQGLMEVAGEDPLPARLTLGSLVRTAWHDTARRLVTNGLVTDGTSTGARSGRATYSVTDADVVAGQRRDLGHALIQGHPDAAQHDLVVVAWASDCFDDLFHVHGREASSALLVAARREVEEDATLSRLTAALAYGTWAW